MITPHLEIYILEIQTITFETTNSFFQLYKLFFQIVMVDGNMKDVLVETKDG